MDVLVGLWLSHAEAGYGLSPVCRLFGIVDHPLAHKFSQPIREQLGMDSQVFLLLECGHYRVRDAAVTDLDGVSILY